MVLFYTSPSHPAYKIYMGLDKFENEKLLQNGFPEDVWWHVNDLSSAHVYVRIPLDIWREMLSRKFESNMGIPAKGDLLKLTEADYRSVLPDALIDELCTLTKGNSISGSKLAEVDMCWTPFHNLLKDQQTMETGTVGFVDEGAHQTWYVKRCPKNRELLKALEKTKVQDTKIDLGVELEQRTGEEMRYRKGLVAARKAKSKSDAKLAAIDKENKSYSNMHLISQDRATTNDMGEDYKGTIEECRDMEDDFM